MKTRKITRTKDGARFVVTFDDYGVADTIERDGKLITSAHKDARAILNNADKLAAGYAPAGFVFTREG
jgi:hypothetical protein